LSSVFSLTYLSASACFCIKHFPPQSFLFFFYTLDDCHSTDENPS
jgi:hypothetical protein